VTVTGVNDHVVTGNRTYVILTAPAISADPHYNGLNPPDVAVINLEGDTAGILVTPTTGLTTTSNGGTATFTVVLSSKPTDDVIITFGSSVPTSGTPSQGRLVFTPANWNTPQVVIVTGLADPGANGDVPYNIVFSPAASADGDYNFLTAPSVSLINLKDAGTPAPLPSPLPAEQSLSAPVAIPSLSVILVDGSKSPGLLPTEDQGQSVVVNLGAGTSVISLSDKKAAATFLRAALGTDSGSPLGQRSSGPEPVVGRAPAGEGTGVTGTVDLVPSLQPETTTPSAPPTPVRPNVAAPNIPTGPAPPAPPTVRSRTDLLHLRIDMATEEPLASRKAQKTSGVVFLGSVAVSVGYVFLSSRGGSFLISALTARPLWKQFDPLEVLFAWEMEKDRRRARGVPLEDEEDQETLQSLVAGPRSAR
jgi:hypothetical protein